MQQRRSGSRGRHRLVAVVLAATMGWIAGPTWAQFPEGKPVRIVVGFAALLRTEVPAWREFLARTEIRIDE